MEVVGLRVDCPLLFVVVDSCVRVLILNTYVVPLQLGLWNDSFSVWLGVVPLGR